MPFPLAHPAAVFPLRRWCPRRLNLGALVIGSLVPDVGYIFQNSHLAAWSHSFWSGGIGFCLPVGFALFWVFRYAQLLTFKIWPRGFAQILRPDFPQSPPPFHVTILSLLIGGWTHILLDSITHVEGWIAQRIPVLQYIAFSFEGRNAKICQLLYYTLTFIGVAYLAFCFQQRLDRTAGNTPRFNSLSKWVFAFLFSGLLLIVCVSGRRAL